MTPAARRWATAASSTARATAARSRSTIPTTNTWIDGPVDAAQHRRRECLGDAAERQRARGRLRRRRRRDLQPGHQHLEAHRPGPDRLQHRRHRRHHRRCSTGACSSTACRRTATSTRPARPPTIRAPGSRARPCSTTKRRTSSATSLPNGMVLGALVNVMFGPGTVLQQFDPNTNTVSSFTPPPDQRQPLPDRLRESAERHGDGDRSRAELDPHARRRARRQLAAGRAVGGLQRRSEQLHADRRRRSAAWSTAPTKATT